LRYLFAPHNDDETLFAAYLVCRYRPTVVTVLASYRQADPAYPGGPIDRKIREGETRDALNSLHTENYVREDPIDMENYVRDEEPVRYGRPIQWPYRDDSPDWAAIEQEMGLLDQQSEYVDLVFAPADEPGGNEQHNAVSRLAKDVFGDRVVEYLTYVNGRERTAAGEEHPPEPWMVSAKLRALACYESQIACPATGHHFLNHDLREYVVGMLP
jgi:hypothetical protein